MVSESSRSGDSVAETGSENVLSNLTVVRKFDISGVNCDLFRGGVGGGVLTRKPNKSVSLAGDGVPSVTSSCSPCEETSDSLADDVMGDGE
jgi:hypothetical protein